MEEKLGKMTDSRDSSASSRSRQPGSISQEKDMRGSSTLQSSVVLSVVIAEKGNKNNTFAEVPGEASHARYLERVKN